MKRILKLVPCFLMSACVLVSVCACSNGNERMNRERTAPELKILHEEPLDPDFSVDPETDAADENASDEDAPENPKCPDCPEKDEDTQEPAPERKKPPHRCKHLRRRPMPFPLPPKRAN